MRFMRIVKIEESKDLALNLGHIQSKRRGLFSTVSPY